MVFTIGLAYPHLITQDTFERDIKNLTGLGEKTLFKVLGNYIIFSRIVRDTLIDTRIPR